jgi:multidrug efflux pump subunit AcrB
MKPSTHVHEEPLWMPLYLRITRWTLNHRWITVALALGFFVGSLMLVPLIPSGFIPPDDNSQTQVYVELPPGSTLAQTRASAERAASAMGHPGRPVPTMRTRGSPLLVRPGGGL